MNRFKSELKQNKKANEWFQSRPKSIKKLVKEFPPYSKVKIKATGQIAEIHSYFEEGIMSVIVTHISEKTPTIPFKVVGYKPEDLTYIGY